MTRPPYKMVDHTGDLAIAISGATPRELFENAARAMFELLLDDSRAVRPVESMEIQIAADDEAGLLNRFLAELLYRFETDGFLVAEVEAHAVARTAMGATVRGERFDEARHAIQRTIKAVTYHELSVERFLDGHIEAFVVFDM